MKDAKITNNSQKTSKLNSKLPLPAILLDDTAYVPELDLFTDENSMKSKPRVIPSPLPRDMLLKVHDSVSIVGRGFPSSPRSILTISSSTT